MEFMFFRNLGYGAAKACYDFVAPEVATTTRAAGIRGLLGAVDTEVSRHFSFRRATVMLAGTGLACAAGWYYSRRRGYRYIACPKNQIPESAVAGSVEYPQRNGAHCQGMVLLEKDPVTLMPVGSFVRFGDFAVLPEHLLPAEKVLLLQNAKREAGKPVRLDLDSQDVIHLATDLIAIKLTQGQWAQLAVRQAKPAALVGEMPVSVRGVDGLGTTAAMRPHKSMFGMTVYGGTTLPGYSGAAYMSGNQVHGIHLHGGQSNGGYEAKYIEALLAALQMGPYESSEEVMKMAIKKAKGKQIWQERDNNVILRDNSGHYHVTPFSDELLRELERVRAEAELIMGPLGQRDWAQAVEADLEDRPLAEGRYEPQGASNLMFQEGATFSGEGQSGSKVAGPVNKAQTPKNKTTSEPLKVLKGKKNKFRVSFPIDHEEEIRKELKPLLQRWRKPSDMARMKKQ
jgi:hypothetical protein